MTAHRPCRFVWERYPEFFRGLGRVRYELARGGCPVGGEAGAVIARAHRVADGQRLADGQRREARDAEGRKDRKSLGHRNRQLAEERARALARRLAEFRYAGAVGPVTLGLVLRAYFQHHGPLLSPARRRTAQTTRALFLAHLGDGFRVDDLTQTHVDTYVQARRGGALQPKRRGGRRDAGARGRGTGRSPMTSRGSRPSSRGRTASNRAAGGSSARPRSGTSPRVAAREEPAPPGRVQGPLPAHAWALRCGRAHRAAPLHPEPGPLHGGRRETAICSLRGSDMLLTPAQVRSALAATGQDEGLAADMPHGAVRWRPETDKLGFEEVTPLGAAARAALEAYLRAHPRVGDAWLFPRDKDPARPVGAAVAGNWLVKAERRAKLPKLERGLFHP